MGVRIWGGGNFEVNGRIPTGGRNFCQKSSKNSANLFFKNFQNFIRIRQALFKTLFGDPFSAENTEKWLMVHLQWLVIHYELITRINRVGIYAPLLSHAAL